MIRRTVPGVGEARRKELAGRVKDLSEEARVDVRNIRRDANRHLDKLKKDSDIGEHDCKRAQDEVQEMTGQSEEKIAEMLKKKTADIMKV